MKGVYDDLQNHGMETGSDTSESDSESDSSTDSDSDSDTSSSMIVDSGSMVQTTTVWLIHDLPFNLV